MKLFKKSSHCLFVEEESYNWAPARSRIGKKLLMVVLLLATVFVLLMALSG